MNHLSSPVQVSRRFDLSRQFAALHKISVALSRSLSLAQTLEATVRALYEHADMQYGMVCLADQTRRALSIETLYGVDTEVTNALNNAHRCFGEGIPGSVMRQRRPLVLLHVSDDPRLLDWLNIYDCHLPFICVPIPGPDDLPVGVLAAQPMEPHADCLPAGSRFLETVANLLSPTVRQAGRRRVEPAALQPERNRPRCRGQDKYVFDNIVGKSQAMRQVFEVIRQVARWDTTVLVQGESGTGKELIANAIHYHSPRARKPFVKFNCAALPDTLLESELFGHEKGAFTGAVSQRKGRFELADGGTLFLDEIGESSVSLQAKLLRILQEGEMERVGGDTTIRVNVRIIAASNRNLEEEARAGNFREDLYYRLSVMPINVPPLRQRREDIVALAQFLIARLAAKQGRSLRLSDGALSLLRSYSWPGNVRELENCLERASVMSEEGAIDRDLILFSQSETRGDNAIDERQRVIAALEKSGWVQAKAARLLGMTPRQVAYRIQTLNINMQRL